MKKKEEKKEDKGRLKNWNKWKKKKILAINKSKTAYNQRKKEREKERRKKEWAKPKQKVIISKK